MYQLVYSRVPDSCFRERIFCSLYSKPHCPILGDSNADSLKLCSVKHFLGVYGELAGHMVLVPAPFLQMLLQASRFFTGKNHLG